MRNRGLINIIFPIIIVVVIAVVVVLAIKPKLDVRKFDRHVGRYSAYTIIKHVSPHARIKAHGIIIDREGDDYYVEVWYDGVDGEVRKGRQKIEVKLEFQSNRPLYYKGQDGTLSLSLTKFGGLSFKTMTKGYTHELQYGMWAGYRIWRTKEFDPATLELTPVEEIVAKIEKGNKRDPALGKRIQWEGTIIEIAEQTREGAEHLMMIRLAPREGAEVILRDIHKMTDPTKTVPDFDTLAAGKQVAYKGTVVAYDQPVGGPTVLELENVFYKVMEP